MDRTVDFINLTRLLVVLQHPGNNLSVVVSPAGASVKPHRPVVGASLALGASAPADRFPLHVLVVVPFATRLAWREGNVVIDRS